ncbi:hypothetical protein B447_15701 [Thauera sp. 27]|uniref:hypothetical protein n=1 Tax=Thauera sp. 27 TaxID=305700 RepID=UPI0002D0FD0B|nr:hypothetical protein [Thauera sp. 27]ENO77383.1 hypothetical protein B447_15701 [Thauera sp. 27]
MAADTAAERFLAEALARQVHNVGAHDFGGERVWVKKAGPRNPRWRYMLMGLLSRALGLGVLSPVPNFGGADAINTEVRRLQTLAAQGVFVPEVLAWSDTGLMLKDLGSTGEPGLSLQQEMATAMDVSACLALFDEGLAALADLHRRGGYLSQGFARNMVRAANGRIAFIDFEDDPGRALGLAQCQARDWLCYLHSTALILDQRELLEAAAPRVRAALAAVDADIRAQVLRTAGRLAWLRHLPRGRRFGRDGQRLRAVAWLLQGLSR